MLSEVRQRQIPYNFTHMQNLKNNTNEQTKQNKKDSQREFPGGLVVRILGFHRRGQGAIPGWGIEIPQAMWHSQKKKRLIDTENKLVAARGKWVGKRGEVSEGD